MGYKVAPKELWTGPSLMGSGPHVKAIFAYLCTKDQLHYSGINYIHPATISGETSWDIEKVNGALAELDGKGLIHWDSACSVVYVPAAAKESIRSPKLIPNIEKHLHTLYNSKVIKKFINDFKQFNIKTPDTLSNTLPDTVSNTLTGICISDLSLNSLDLQINKESGEAGPPPAFGKNGKEEFTARGGSTGEAGSNTSGAGQKITAIGGPSTGEAGSTGPARQSTARGGSTRGVGKRGDEFTAWLGVLQFAKDLKPTPPIIEVINHINNRLGSNFTPDSIKSLRCMHFWMRKGYTAETMIRVFDQKCEQWRFNAMAPNLRPQTVFGQNFEDYVNEPATPVDHERVTNLVNACHLTIGRISEGMIKASGKTPEEVKLLVSDYKRRVKTAMQGSNVEQLEQLLRIDWGEVFKEELVKAAANP